MKYGIERKVDYTFEEAVERVLEELAKDGFGPMTRIDVDEKLKEKLGIEYKKYVILGMCNPKYSYEALKAEENIGLFLPCNVIVYESENQCTVAVLKPTIAMGGIENDIVLGLLTKVEGIFKGALDRI